jgi:hypothetical protein
MDMLGLLGHMDLMPLFYGIIMFLGIWSMWHKLTTGRLGSFAIEAGVFALVFTLHGGTMAGGFAAMIAALIAGRVLGRRRI